MPDGIMLFVVDNEIKQEFLKSQMKSTSKSYAYVLKKADEFEHEINKKLYDFNMEDIDELLLIKYKNSSEWAVQSVVSPLRKYVDFCISKHLVETNENRFLTIMNYSKYVNDQAVENMYTPKEEIRELQEYLNNDQDKLILELLSWGIRGRTERENTFEELVNLRVKDVKYDKNLIYLYNNDGDFRYVEVDDYTIKLIKKVINQEGYIANNGFKTHKNEFGVYEPTKRILPINETEWVFRTPGKVKSGQVVPQFFTRRIANMQKWLNKPYLTSGSLYFSAMIDYAKQLKEEKDSDLTKEDYIRINERFQYGENGQKYWWKTQEMVNKYI